MGCERYFLFEKQNKVENLKWNAKGNEVANNICFDVGKTAVKFTSGTFVNSLV